uniref:Uncharacterized protein n=1 Tax=Scylla paramamosain TaxID=85552 RepID=D2DT45_SCYPA|nr:hypothetical protein [Scylla paramamosain]
MWFLFGWLV